MLSLVVTFFLINAINFNLNFFLIIAYIQKLYLYFLTRYVLRPEVTGAWNIRFNVFSSYVSYVQRKFMKLISMITKTEFMKNDPFIPLGNPVLEKYMRSRLLWKAKKISTLFYLSFVPVPTMTAVGVASPSAQGQAMARTESAILNANCHVISSGLNPSLEKNMYL